MITFDNIRFLNQPTKTGRQLVCVDITVNSVLYTDWIVYTPFINGDDLNSYFAQISKIVQQDIEYKETIWATSPHTETIEDELGNTITVDIPKTRIVSATIPDYIEVLSDVQYTQDQLDHILGKLPNNYWHYTQYAKRIIAPISLIMDDVGVKMYNWFQINKFPILKFGNSVHLYCNVILPEHQTIVDSLQGVIVIEDRP